MPERIPLWPLWAVLLLAVPGCVSHKLGAGCRIAPSRTTWANTLNAGRVEGTVRELRSKGPIGNLEIHLVDLDRRRRTDGQGAFRFDSVPEGRHVLVTAGSVYQAREDTLVVSAGSGVRGSIDLSTRHDVLTQCPFYRQ
jgi:hypothetical protein